MTKLSLTYEQQEFIRSNHKFMTGTEMAKFLKVKKGVVNTWARKNGCKTPKELVIYVRAGKNSLNSSSTTEIDSFLIENYLRTPLKTLADQIGKSDSFVATRLRQLELFMPKEIIEQRKIDSRFKPGHQPLNKGLKMDPEIKERIKHTFFKKGHNPVNTLYDGAIVIRHNHKHRGEPPYKWIRIGPGKWIHYHRYLWIEANGHVPAGMMITFKDGDTLNCVFENLEMISMQDNAIRNRLKRYPEEIVKTVQARSLLNRTIKQITEKYEQKQNITVRTKVTPVRRNRKIKVIE